MLRMSVFSIAAAVAGLLVPGAASAQFSGDWGAISSSIAVATDYTFRGVSQTIGRPALQGAAEYTKEVGPVTPYAGLFASNVMFPDTSSSGKLDAKIELDLMFGLRGEIEKFKWDVGYIRYYYPNSDLPPAASQSLDWSEGAVKLSYDLGFLTALGSYFYSPNYSIASGHGHYWNLGADVPLPFYDIVFGARLGHLRVKDNANLGLPDYTDWALGINRDFPEIWGINLALTYTDTNIKKNAFLENKSNNSTGTLNDRVHDTTTPRIILALTKKF